MSDANIEREINYGPAPPKPGNILTGGEFENEPAAWEWFDAMIDRSKSFRNCKEVRGTYIQPRIDTDEKDARIDRVLIPLKPAIEAGWGDGAIGIEGKKSGTKIGKLISQAMDYTRCVWELEEHHSSVPGLLLMTRWVFIYPVDRIVGDIESIMAQNRIGYVRISSRMLAFSCGGTNGITIDAGGLIDVKQLPMGRKRGSR